MHKGPLGDRLEDSLLCNYVRNFFLTRLLSYSLFSCIFTGYGYITPQTTTGRILCIFAALFGIPGTLLALSSTGELTAKWVNALVRKTEKKLFKRKEPKQVQTKSAAILFLFMICLMVVNCTLVTHLFDWTFMEGLYFSFIYNWFW